MPIYVDLTPTEAVTAARRDVAAGQEEAWDALDGCLRWHLLTYLQDRTGEAAELRDALLEATRWARHQDHSPWCHRWPYLLELLRDGERLPSTAGAIQALQGPEGRAAQMLALLVKNREPMRPGELAERLGLSPQQVSNLGRQLEDAELIVRRRARGRATWMFATPRGFQLTSSLPQAATVVEPRDLAPAYDFWSSGADPIPAVH